MKAYHTMFFLCIITLSAFAENSYLQYKVYSGEPTNVVVWSQQPNALIHNFSHYYSESLPGGLSYQVEEVELNENHISYTGRVSGTPITVDGPNDGSLHTWSTSEDSYGNPVDKHQFSHFQVDDYADYPNDTSHLGSLPALTSWSDNENYGWSNGFLTASSDWYDLTIPEDLDVFKVACTTGIYCIETKVTGDLGFLPLEITVFEDDGAGNYGRQLAVVNDWNVFDKDGKCNQLNQRLYFKVESKNSVFVQLRFIDTLGILHLNYAIRAFKAQPVVTIHGINAYPKTSQDTETTFGDIPRILPYIKEIKPSWCYDFPWDSRDDDNPEGFKRYVGDSEKTEESLYKFTYGIFNYHNREKVNIITHSMGGFLIRFQLAKPGFSDMIDQVMFIDSPQYGSELANFMYRRRNVSLSPAVTMNSLGKIFNDFWDMSIFNAHHLMRGGDTIYEMHNLGTVIPPENFSCTIGTEKGYYNKLPAAMTGYDGFQLGRAAARLNPATPHNHVETFAIINAALQDQYCNGLKHSDGIVPVSSQNMKSLHPDIETVYIAKCHTDAQQLYEGKFSDSRPLYDLIKKRINQ